MSASRRDSRIEIETSGSLEGAWDKARLAQTFGNLVGNAVQHGLRNGPITVAACGDDPQTVTVSVTNEGAPIRADQIGGLFEAMKGSPNDGDRRHLGLGSTSWPGLWRRTAAPSTYTHPKRKGPRSSSRFLDEPLHFDGASPLQRESCLVFSGVLSVTCRSRKLTCHSRRLTSRSAELTYRSWRLMWQQDGLESELVVARSRPAALSS